MSWVARGVAGMKSYLSGPGVWRILPLVILFYSLVVKLCLYDIAGTEYWDDEVVVTEVSKQGMGQLLNTVQAEPHPVGFYIFLKLLPVNDVYVTRSILAILSYVLIAGALVWANKRSIIEKYDLGPGLALFFTSYTFLELTGHVRHEIVSFPGFLWYMLILTKLVGEGLKPKFNLVAAHLLIILLSLLGYLYYVLALGMMLLVVWRAFEKDWLPRMLAVFQVVYFVIYLRVWVYGQLITNLSRLGWWGDYFNSFMNAMSVHLVGRGFTGPVSDVVGGLFVFLVARSFLLIRAKNGHMSKFRSYVNFATGGILILVYLTRAMVRTRYTSVLFLLLSVAAGWGLRAVKIRHQTLLGVVLVGVFFATSMASFATLNVGGMRVRTVEMLKIESREERYGFLEDNGVFPGEIMFPKTDNSIIPVYVLQPGLFEGYETIERRHLMAEGKSKVVSANEVKGKLIETNLHNYFYRFRIKDKSNQLDPERLVMKVLDENCKERKLLIQNNDWIIFAYRSCFLED